MRKKVPIVDVRVTDNSLDAGLQLSVNFISSIADSIVADIKYQLLTEPLYLAVSIGPGVHYMLTDAGTFYPMVQALLIGGWEIFYIGIKPVAYLYNQQPNSLEHLSARVGGGIFAGLMFGEKTRLSLELNGNYYVGPVFSLGAGLQFVF